MICYGCFQDKGGRGSCPKCGYSDRVARPQFALPHDAFLKNRKYRIGRLLGKPGGFGITYLGRDEYSSSLVAIKEFFPRDIVTRKPGGFLVEPNSDEDLEILRYSLTSFLGEAKTLAAVSHRNIVKVRDYFQENGTAYLVMDYYSGTNLHDYIASQVDGRLNQTDAIKLISPILDSLHFLHSKGFLHRDIKPLNIYITKEGVPLLLDFGAARYIVGEKTKSLTVILSLGYAPLEQYQRHGNQGPWTDVYAVAATLYMMITGRQPPPATDRVHDDALKSEGFGVHDDLLLRLMGAALEIDYRKRTQDISVFRDGLSLYLSNQKKNARNKQEVKPGLQHGSNLRYNLKICFIESLLGVTVNIPVPQDIVCRECQGKGRLKNQGKPICQACRGKGIYTVKKSIKVNVPAGIDSGERITIPGEGDESPDGGIPGDLFVQIQIDPDPIYRRKGLNIKRDLRVSSRTAINGGKIKTSTPWGDVFVTVPPSSVDGQLLRLKGKGVKSANNSFSGDLICRILIDTNESFLGRIKRFFHAIGL
jgi:serine/threonine protein kinase